MNGLDPREFVDEISLMARQENVKPELAVEIAFEEFQARRRIEEIETFDKYQKSLVAELRRSRGR